MNVARIATRQRRGRGGSEQVGGSFEGKCVQRTRWERGRGKEKERENERTRGEK